MGTRADSITTKSMHCKLRLPIRQVGIKRANNNVASYRRLARTLKQKSQCQGCAQPGPVRSTRATRARTRQSASDAREDRMPANRASTLEKDLPATTGASIHLPLKICGMLLCKLCPDAPGGGGADGNKSAWRAMSVSSPKMLTTLRAWPGAGSPPAPGIDVNLMLPDVDRQDIRCW